MFHPHDPALLAAFAHEPYGGLAAGQRYRVVRAFTDFDGAVLATGWEGVYRAYNCFPYDDGLSLALDTDAGMTILRLQAHAEAQQAIVDALMDYFAPVRPL